MTNIPPPPLGDIIDRQKPVLPYWGQATDTSCSEFHKHPRGQFIYSSKGVTRVVTEQGIYLIPSQQAFWCPPNHGHMLIFPGTVDIANLFIDPEWSARLPKKQQVFNVSPLLKELIMKAIKIGENYKVTSKGYRLMEIIVDEIEELPASPLTLPWTEHRKLQKIMSSIIDHPEDNRTFDQWADSVHISTRTLARLFKHEVNMTFSEWRLQARLFYALERLYGGTSVTAIALDLGYSTPSAFISAFKRVLGKSPMDYIAKGGV